VRIDRQVFVGFLAGVVTGTVVGLAGFLLDKSNANGGMGAVMFLLVPYCAGFAICLVIPTRNTKITATAWFAAFASLLMSLAALLAMKEEGLLCVILAFPWLAAGLVVGGYFGHLFQRLITRCFLPQGPTTMTFFCLFPLLIFAGKKMEQPKLMQARQEVISDSILLPASPERVWANIQSIDSIDVPKPFLMHIGLPVPQRCTLERTGVGARRTCYFDNGLIEETITAWDPPHKMQLVIDRTNMPGRHWLGFETAEYVLEPEGNLTKLTRTTTITSHLYPVWYWRYFERLGVSSEHRYILQNVAERLSR
jgi:hypothetical protein